MSAAIAVAVVGALITFWGVQQARQMRIERAERIGESLKAIGNAVETFTVKHHGEIDKLLSGKGGDVLQINGVEFKRKVLPDNSVRLDNLNATTLIQALRLPGVSDKPPPGVGQYEIHVDRVCEVKDACRIETLTFLTEPIRQTYSSDADINMSSIAARKIGTYGGLSTPDNPDQIRFIDQAEGVLPIVNPKAGVAGLLAMRGGSQTKDLNNTVSRDGSRAMSGDLNFADAEAKDASNEPIRHNIAGVGNIKGNGHLEMGALAVGDASFKGRLNLNSESDIVGAKDIRGDGELSMSAVTAKSVDVGVLSANEDAATMRGKLQMTGNDIDDAKKVSAEEVLADAVRSKKLKAMEGIVEFDKDNLASEGGGCNVNGISLDTSGRVLSCQFRNNAWVWQLASMPRSVTDVPTKLVEEITDVARQGNQLWLAEIPVDGSRLDNRGRNRVRADNLALIEIKGALGCSDSRHPENSDQWERRGHLYTDRYWSDGRIQFSNYFDGVSFATDARALINTSANRSRKIFCLVTQKENLSVFAYEPKHISQFSIGWISHPGGQTKQRVIEGIRSGDSGVKVIPTFHGSSSPDFMRQINTMFAGSPSEIWDRKDVVK
ncbi:hypothetical protein A9762_07165 [Pandoraea sp. ISTKB]|nr:hypothetical protein A9762_07165 [Pandoraea sp. ISTKB]